jgi:hypothetical protein
VGLQKAELGKVVLAAEVQAGERAASPILPEKENHQESGDKSCTPI